MFKKDDTVSWDRAHSQAVFTVAVVFENAGSAVIEDDHGYRYLALLTELGKAEN